MNISCPNNFLCFEAASPDIIIATAAFILISVYMAYSFHPIYLYHDNQS